LFFVACFIGCLGWVNTVFEWAQVIILLIPALWHAASNRFAGGAVFAGYTLLASHSLIVGMATYFNIPIYQSSLLWLLAGLPNFLIGVMCWRQDPLKRTLFIPVLIVIHAIPPFALLGWGNPITAAGWLFPGWGWGGIVSTIIVMMVLSRPSRFVARLLCIVPVLAVAAYATTSHQPVQITDWQGYNTHYQYGAGLHQTRNLITEYMQQKALQNQIDSAYKVHVFPESVGGVWNDAIAKDCRRFVVDRAPEHIILLGTHQRTSEKSYDNVIIKMDAQSTEVVYRQRVPAPFGMWKPWHDDSANADWFGTSNAKIAGKKVGFLLCYESMLVFPVIQMMVGKPDIITLSASTWWAPDSLHSAQVLAVHSWANLFNVPTIEAYNL